MCNLITVLCYLVKTSYCGIKLIFVRKVNRTRVEEKFLGESQVCTMRDGYVMVYDNMMPINITQEF